MPPLFGQNSIDAADCRTASELGIRPKTTAGRQDLVDAKQLMPEAAYPTASKSGTPHCRWAPTLTSAGLSDNSWRKPWASPASLKRCPVQPVMPNMALSRSVDSEGIWEIACQGDWMVVYDVGAIYGGIYLRGGTRNYTGWPNDKMVDWFERQKVEQEPEARRGDRRRSRDLA